ncbi:hypothetical protein BU23DRAFT_636953 [Bimuria novae-zelandiae CBS 107.79]|uniref:Uncharacterized protein n=1 Tax=Bimuria novae-zelandiae CBS 107.79 TaxID=1447943 RepID=A0A6A5VS67_9PLEO|nr:hypothetical protein BU23DRAFT_636953 [Bimuria novae-zelandiae CBS 107.79]
MTGFSDLPNEIKAEVARCAFTHIHIACTITILSKDSKPIFCVEEGMAEEERVRRREGIRLKRIRPIFNARYAAATFKNQVLPYAFQSNFETDTLHVQLEFWPFSNEELPQRGISPWVDNLARHLSKDMRQRLRSLTFHMAEHTYSENTKLPENLDGWLYGLKSTLPALWVVSWQKHSHKGWAGKSGMWVWDSRADGHGWKEILRYVIM